MQLTDGVILLRFIEIAPLHNAAYAVVIPVCMLDIVR